MDIDLEQLREIMRSLKEFGVSEFELERDKERLRLVRQDEHTAGASAHRAGTHVTITPQVSSGAWGQANGSENAPSGEFSRPPATREEPADDPSIHYITSPFVGTFYAAPSPGAEAFVRPGSHIKPGQPLCIVEAMKLMNEIEAEVAGEILEVLAANGKPVEYGDKLFKVRKP